MGENIFHIAEVVSMGIEKEKKRRDFYAQVARHFKEGDMKKLFSSLRDWEEVHIKKFTEIKEKIIEPETQESFAGEAKLYMESLVDERLYRQVSPGSFSKKISNPLSAIDYGMQFEKDAILFFSELARLVPSYSRDIIDTLIEEERKHLLFLSKLREKYIHR